MFNLRKKYSPKKLSLAAVKDHKWIFQNKYIHESFKEIFDQINKNSVISKRFKNKDLLFLRANGFWSITLSYDHKNEIVIVFNELFKVLNSARPRLGQAVLAHELGHIFYGHSGSLIDPLKAQVQADLFAAELGYAKEMLEVIEDLHSGHEETRVRITYLNSYLAEHEPNLFLGPHRHLKQKN